MAATLSTWRRVPSKAPELGPPPRFFIYDHPALNHSALLGCGNYDWRFDDSAAEVPMIDLLSRHSARTYNPEQADLFVVPVFPQVSHKVQACRSLDPHFIDHPRRMQAAADALQQSPNFLRRGGRDHLIVTNSFRIACLGPLRDLMRNGTIAWFEDPRAQKKHEGPNKIYEMATWRCTVVIPYQASPFCRTLGPSNPARDPTSTVFFQGSADAGRGVRKNFDKLSTYPGVNISTSSRESIIATARSGGSLSSRYSPLGTAQGMLRSNFCLVPKGDTPTSSRLYTAVACGCVPILISNEIKAHQPFPHVLPPNRHFWNLGVPQKARKEGASPREQVGPLGDDNDAVPRPIWIMEAPFMDNPAKQLDIKLRGQGGLVAHLPQLQDTLRELAPDVLYDVEGSRVGHNMLMEWKEACSGDPLPPLFPVKGGGAKGIGAKANGKASGSERRRGASGKAAGGKAGGKAVGGKGAGGKGVGGKGVGGKGVGGKRRGKRARQ